MAHDTAADALRTFDTLIGGGTAIIPTHVGYAIVGITEEAIHRTFVAKGRASEKLHAFTGCPELHEALHVLDDDKRAVIRTLWQECELTFGCVAPARLDHPMIRKLPPAILSQSLHEGTVAMLLGAGPFLDALGRLSLEHETAVIGSSANLTQRGVKFSVEEIEPEIVEAADLVIDYGLMRWAEYGMSSTMIDFRDYTVVRRGACFDLIEEVLSGRFGIEIGG
jgi:tRNA A37 threonylcarbamoyladenosine synthetase subunit TsaC/SUA5/YrdC